MMGDFCGDIKTLFICGGVGRRMSPVSEDKVLLTFLGKTVIEYQVQCALLAGLHRFIFVCNPENVTAIKKLIQNLPGIETTTVIQEEPDGIAGALESAGQFLDGPFFIVNPNDIFEPSLYSDLFLSCAAGKAVSYVAGYKIKDYFPGGYLVTAADNSLVRIVEKPGAGNEPSNMVNLLVHFHTDPYLLLSFITKVQTDKDDVYECALNDMCINEYPVEVVPYGGSWNAIKYPWNLLDVTRYFLSRTSGYIAHNVAISNRAVVEGPVFLEEGVRIMENAVIRGPVYIGRNTIIGNNTLVRDYTHIGADCVIGFGTEIKHSYIGDGSSFHMSYVGDSVIGKGCSFAAGTITANWRLDSNPVNVLVGDVPVNSGKGKLGVIMGDNCRTGVHVSLMPGIKIGTNSVIGPGVCVYRDVREKSEVFSQQRRKTQTP